MLKHPVVNNMPSGRDRMSKGRDRRVFSKTADRAHGANMKANPMRGGIRL